MPRSQLSPAPGRRDPRTTTQDARDATEPGPLFDAPRDAVFDATLQAVRTMRGWEVLTAHPETGEIRAAARAGVFTPGAEHVFQLSDDAHGVRLVHAAAARRGKARIDDDHTKKVFYAIVADLLEDPRW